MQKRFALTASAVLLSSSFASQVMAEGSVEVLHWWTSGGEAAAVGVLKEDLEGKGIGWEDMAVSGGGGDAARTTLKARVTSGNPPAAAQMLGMSVREWSEQDGALGNLNDIAESEGWEDVVPGAVKAFAKADGNWVAAPVNIHRPHWVWANPEVLAKAGLDAVPENWEDFNAAAKKLMDMGITPLAHGGQPWQDATIWEAVVLGLGGADFYQKAILDADMDAIQSDTMKQVFDQMRVMRGFVDDNFSGRDWNLATAMVMNGEAAMQIMGDWAKGEIVAASKTPGEDILCSLVPGTEGSFLFNTDFFAMFNVGDDKKEAQQQLASSIVAPGFQETFNLTKGSIPANTEVSDANFDLCGQKSMADIKTAEANGSLMGSLAHGHGQPSAVQGAFIDVVTEHFNSDMSSEDAVAKMAAAVEDAQF